MRSTERILTTHTGSLPKPDDLVRLLWAQNEGEDLDEAALEARISQTVKDLVAQQAEVGIDVVSDGETSKPGFSTYIYERYTGFGEVVDRLTVAKDFVDYPELAVAMLDDEGAQHVRMRECEGPIELKDPEPVKRDIANLAAAPR